MKYWYHHKTATPSLTPLQTAAPCLLESQKRYQATSSSCNASSKLKPEELWQDVGCWVIWVIWSFFDATFLKFFGCLWKKGQVRFFLLSLAQFPSLEDGDLMSVDQLKNKTTLTPPRYICSIVSFPSLEDSQGLPFWFPFSFLKISRFWGIFFFPPFGDLTFCPWVFVATSVAPV